MTERMRDTTTDAEVSTISHCVTPTVFLPREALNFMLSIFYSNFRTFVVSGASVTVVYLHMCVHIRAGPAKKLPMWWLKGSVLLNSRSLELKLQQVAATKVTAI